MSDRLTPLQFRFVLRYCENLGIDGKPVSATQCAIDAGCPESGAASTATAWLKTEKIQNAIAKRKEELASAAAVTPELVLREWLAIATADPNELCQVRKTCCRYCWGYDFHYQWTEGEYHRALQSALASEPPKPAPDGAGGFGYDQNRDPHPDCPECGGLGVLVDWLADTRKLSGKARKLYAGVKRTQHGVQVLMRDQDAALTNLAKYLGMLIDRKELSGPNKGPIAISDAKELTDDQLAAIARLGAAE